MLSCLPLSIHAWSAYGMFLMMMGSISSTPLRVTYNVLPPIAKGLFACRPFVKHLLVTSALD